MADMLEKEETNRSGEPGEEGGGKGKKRSRLFILALLFLVGALAGGSLWYRHQVRISTDDAFVETSVHAISARVPGQVLRVLVEDNQRVKKGDLLVELDPGDYRARVEKAKAELGMARSETSGYYAQVSAVKAALAQAEARREQRVLDLERGEALFEKEVIPRQSLERLRTERKVATGLVDEVRENLRRAQALVGQDENGGRESRIAKRQAELEQALLNLSYTRMYAPADGFVTRKSVEIGNNIRSSQGLLALVGLSRPWVVANFKETQLTNIRPGQKVEIGLDAYPDEVCTGKVESIMAGTGAAFSLLPPENATGNYVKVVQRVPVKILIDEECDAGRKLRVGLSVTPTVLTGRSLKDALLALIPFG